MRARCWHGPAPSAGVEVVPLSQCRDAEGVQQLDGLLGVVLPNEAGRIPFCPIFARYRCSLASAAPVGTYQARWYVVLGRLITEKSGNGEPGLQLAASICNPLKVGRRTAPPFARSRREAPPKGLAGASKGIERVAEGFAGRPATRCRRCRCRYRLCHRRAVRAPRCAQFCSHLGKFLSAKMRPRLDGPSLALCGGCAEN